MRPEIDVWDDVLADPIAYRAAALAQPFASVTLGGVTFHGIAPAPDASLRDALADRIGLAPETPVVTFLRQSPAGQIEPNLVHSDRTMGAFTTIYYLTLEPAPGDGTAFYRARATGAPIDDGTVPWDAVDAWVPWLTVAARFNRAVRFPAAYAHSRALPGNYGSGAGARLIQVVFEGDPTWR
jgi:hypothetical protein